jgi:hypothetical protein
MQASKFVLVTSLAANLALGAWLLTAAPKPAGQIVSNRGDAGVATASAQANQSEREARAVASAALWQRLDAGGDFKSTIARLRAAGFPPDVVRAIVASLVTARFEAERSKIDTAALHTPYWKKWTGSYLDPQIGPALRKLEQEQERTLKELLGDAGADPNPEETAAWREARWGKLSAEKVDRISAVMRAYDEKQMAIYSAASGGGRLTMLPADREKMAALDRELRSDLAEFLTPAEIEEYNLRASTAARQLEWVLSPFKASEAEYRTIFPLYQEYLDRFPRATSLGSNEADPAQAAAQDAFVAQVAAKLGSERADELRIALDPKLANVGRLVSRLDLPLSAAQQVYDVQQDVQKRAAAVRSNQELAAAARAEQLTALQQEAVEKLTRTLGGTRELDAYRQYGGQWLSTLAPPKG